MASAGAVRAGRAYIELYADNNTLIADLKKAEDTVRAFSRQVGEIGRQMMEASSVVLAPAALSTKVFAGFDDQMRAVQAVTGATGEQFDKLTEKAKQLGANKSFKAEEVAGGMLELGRAGFKTDEIDKSIEAVMDLAKATQTDLPTATAIAANTLRQFGLDASEMTRVCDVLATTANGSATTLTELGEAFKYAGTTSAMTGETLEDLAKNLGTQANLGIKGSMAGTSLRAIQTRMANESVQKEYAALGIDTTDAEGNLRNVADILKEFQEKTKDMGSGERISLFQKLFGTRGMTGGAAIAGNNFDELFDAIDNAAGRAAEVAEQMEAGIGGTMRRFQSAIEGAAIQIGEALAPEIQRLTQWITENTTAFIDWIKNNEDTIKTAAEIALKIGAAGAALVAFGETAKIAAGIIGVVGTAGSLVGGLAAVAGIAAVIGTHFLTAKDGMTEFADAAEKVTAEHEEAARVDNGKLERLAELAEKQDKSNQETLEALQLVEELNSKYKDLNLTYDETSGKLEGLSEAQRKLAIAQANTRYFDAKDELAALKKDFDKNYGEATQEFTREQIEEADKHGQYLFSEGGGWGKSYFNANGSNLSRAVYNESTGKYRLARLNESFMGDRETAEEARDRLGKQLAEEAEAKAAIAAKQEQIANLDEIRKSMSSGGAAAEPAPAPAVTAAAEQAAEEVTEQVKEQVKNAASTVAEETQAQAEQIARDAFAAEVPETPAETAAASEAKASSRSGNWKQLLEYQAQSNQILSEQKTLLSAIRDAVEKPSDLL